MSVGLLEKLKWLLKIQRPAGEVITAVKEVKKSKKWFHFAVTLVGTLATTAAALTGVIPPDAQVIASSFLQAIYNIMRGADKADIVEVKGTLRTTEWWLASFTELQKAVVITKAGGVVAPWVEIFGGVINFGALALGQNLAARTPATETK